MPAIVQGTLKPDGTLELDEKLSLPPGRVRVAVESLSTTSARRGLVEVMDEIRQSQRARGYLGRSLEEMQAEEATRRDEDEDYERRCQQLWGTCAAPPAEKE